jgi:hypothetical protein
VAKPCKKKSTSCRTYQHLLVTRTRNLRRRALAGEPVVDLAREYGVHPTTVRGIRAGRTKRGM